MKPAVGIASRGFVAGHILLLLWVAGCVFWNLFGVVRIAHGMRAPGPTASIVSAVILVAVGLLLIFTSRRVRWLYLVLSVLSGIAAMATIVSAFTSDPLLWPSTLWRFTGVAINGIGVVGTAIAVIFKPGSAKVTDRSLDERTLSV